MKLKLKKLVFDAGNPIVFLNRKQAQKLNVHIGDRVEVSANSQKVISVADIFKGFLADHEVALSEEAVEHLKIKTRDVVELRLALNPKSDRFIMKKVQGKQLKKDEIWTIIKDIVDNSLTEAEISYFVSGVAARGMTLKETIYLTEAMYKTGETIKWRREKIADKHSIGGIPGNRTTPIVVSICASAGIIIPKTSSRAITSAAGTADVIETISPVDLSISTLKKVVKKTGACLAWNGSFALSPADDKLIRVEKMLDLDPKSQLIASILSKKLAVGSKYVLIDIPYGRGAKVSKKEAKDLKSKFNLLGKHFGLKVKAVLTDGSQPIGNGIGPVLEMKDILKVLKQKKDNYYPQALETKSIFLAGELIEMLGKAKKGEGKARALSLLESGKAFDKFKQIINAQGGLIDERKLVEARKTYEFRAPHSGNIKRIDNKEIGRLGRILGCPSSKSAGIYLFKHVGDKIEKNETILKVFSESDRKLKEAKQILKSIKIIDIER